MKIQVSSSQCQLPCLQTIATGNANGPPISPQRRLRLMIRRKAGPNRERKFKKISNRFISDVVRFFNIAANRNVNPSMVTKPTNNISQGDWVKVRPFNEIQSGLNYWRQSKGCTFMPEMAEYCGSIQRVYKVMETFVDERDYILRKSKGIILLNGVKCDGTAEFGDCDRTCLHFWRKEWLQKIEKPSNAETELRTEKKSPDKWVTVKSFEKIQQTFDGNNSLKGCAFLPEMKKYCNTKQKVLKNFKTFVDEKDLRLKKTDGIVLLDGTICQGDLGNSRCDRSCNFLWRKEWLES